MTCHDQVVQALILVVHKHDTICRANLQPSLPPGRTCIALCWDRAFCMFSLCTPYASCVFSMFSLCILFALCVLCVPPLTRDDIRSLVDRDNLCQTTWTTINATKQASLPSSNQQVCLFLHRNTCKCTLFIVLGCNMNRSCLVFL